MLKEHMRVHDNIREYLCAECGKGEGRWGTRAVCSVCVGGRGEGESGRTEVGGPGCQAGGAARPHGCRPDPSHLLKKDKT